MPLLTVLSDDPNVFAALRAPFGRPLDVARARTWTRLRHLLRERPSTGVVLDSAALSREPDAAIVDLRRRFPSVFVVLAHRPNLDPRTLLRLGRVKLDGLALLHLDETRSALHDALRRASSWSTESFVVRAIGTRIPKRELSVIRLALEGVQLGWSTGDLADHAGVSRAHLSVCLRSSGLPSAGHLLLWAKLLHAGRWLSDPGRSAESVSRQLEYSSGAAFRRALTNYVAETPTAVRQAGGLDRVLDAFLDVCDVGASVSVDRSVA